MFFEETSYEMYRSIVRSDIFYNTPEFNRLNQGKVYCVRFFIFKDRKCRFGLCVGEQDGAFLVPFSAPFSSFVPARKNWKMKQLDDAICCLDDFIKQKGIKKNRFILPPTIYDETLVTSMQNGLLRAGYIVKQQELNYSILLAIEDALYIERLPSNGRKNLMSALRKDSLALRYCKTTIEKKSAYDIIACNRAWHGYPLHMSWEEVKDTIEIVPHEFFLVSNGKEDIAAAMVYHATEKIAQVIYWGDIPNVSEWRPMNYLAYRLMQYYRDRGMKYLDVGPSTENGIPNYGLCDFKRSIGCEVNAKFVLEKVFD